MFQPDATEAQIVAWVEDEFKKARTARQGFERQWFTNMAFYFGRQWVTWGQSGSFQYARMIEPPAPSWRVRLTINKVVQYVNRELSRLNSSRIRGFVMPATGDAHDAAVAKIAEDVFDYLSSLTDLELQQLIADLWCCFTGNGYLKVYYDANEFDFRTGTQGKICVEAKSPWHLFVPHMDETLLDNQPWIMEAAIKPVEWVIQTFGVALKPEDKNSGDILEDRMLNAMQISEKDSTTHGVLVKEVWIKPNALYPMGCYVRVAQGKVLVEQPQSQMDEQGNELPPEPVGLWQPWPYVHMQYPYIQRIHTLSNRFYGKTFVDDLISLQRQYNRARSQVIENVNKVARPVWMVQRGSVDVRTITTEPGAVIQYIAGAAAPKQEQPAQIPQYVFLSIDQTREEMDGVASQHEVSQGSVPPNVEAATAISFLQERDDAALFAAVLFKEKAYEKLGQQMLSLVGQFWDAERMVRVVGKNRNYEAFLFKGSDLAGNTDFRVVTGSGTPQSRAARKAELMELIKMGIIPPQKGLAYLDMPELGRLYEEMQIDVKQAQRENIKMMNGIDGFIDVNQDHMIHIDEHDDFTKTQEWENLDDNAKLLFKTHTYRHLQIITYIFGLTPQVPENRNSPEFQQMGIDPVFETELRRLYTLLKTSGGMPQMPAPPSSPNPQMPVGSDHAVESG